MSLASIRIHNVRSLREAFLEFAPGLNLIHGPNGSGKTSILESVFLCGRGRSFRTRNTEQLITRGSNSLQIFAQTHSPAHRIGFEYRRDESYLARMDGEDVRSLAELPRAVFIEVIDPEIHRLVEGSPGDRRQWLDWGVFHVEQAFLQHWLRFTRALRQRNAALKQGLDPTSWDGEIAIHGEAVAEERGAWFETLRPFLCEAVARLSGIEVEINYFRGWSSERSLSEVLLDGQERDRARGSTLSGPHRADVHLRVAGRAARDSLSRGQQKLVASAMVLAVIHRLRREGGAGTSLLLDDPAAELDARRLQGLVEVVRELDCQLLITSLNPDLQGFGKPQRLFHVEQGRVLEQP